MYAESKEQAVNPTVWKGFSLGYSLKKGHGIFGGKVKNSNFAITNKNLSFINSSCLW